MTAGEFNDSLRELLFREPFRPFTVELNTGKRIEIDRANAMAFRDGGAAFLGPDRVPHWFKFSEVKQFISDAENPAA